MGQEEPNEAVLQPADLWVPRGDDAALLADRRNVVPFLGAGISRAERLPDVEGLRAALIDEFEPTLAHEDLGLFEVADVIVGNDRDQRQRLYEFISQFFSVAVDEHEPEQISRSLAQIPSRLIVTLNYDLLIEKAAEVQGIECLSLNDVNRFQDFDQLVRDPSTPGSLTVLHVHGSVAHPEHMVLHSGSYANLINNGVLAQTLESLVARKTLCYLGISLNEPHLQPLLLLGMQHSDRRHPIFMTAEDRETTDLAEGRRFGLSFCDLPSYAHMNGLVRYLNRPAEAVDPILAGETARGPDENYVQTNLIERDDDRDDQTLDYLVAAMRATGHRNFGPEGALLDEEAVSAGHRDVVVGVPGSGKSETMRYAAQLVGPGSQALIIRVPDLAGDFLDAPALLNRWTDLGQLVTPETLPQDQVPLETFHFFLDGLDEVAPRLQGHYARQIGRVAEAYPEHAITVSTRSVEAIETFARPSWRWLDLVPGTDWQMRYLDQRGVTLDEILGALDGGQSLGELIRLPFFLSSIVDLYEAERLGDLNLWGVVRALVDEAITKEGPRLPVDPGVARKWLSQVALAMQISGTIYLRADQLDAVVLEAVPATDREEVCEVLVQRNMLQKSGEGYSFLHRIIGESLVAEELLEIGPQDELLGTIAPVDGELVGGISSDWRVPISFLLPDSEDWRRAVKDRDPLHWARTVPDTEHLELRCEAARLIWETYLDWKIWIWDYEVPDFLQDGQALSRHLRSGGMDDLIEEIVAAIDHDSAQVQGNAIRVLGQAEVDGLEDRLDAVLRDDERDAVVRRQAAFVAGQKGLTGLSEIILLRALNPADESEAQDCSSAAMRLAAPEQIENVADQLLRHPSCRSVVLSRFDEALNPHQRLRVLRNYAQVNQDVFSLEKRLLEEAIDEADELEPVDIQNAVFIAVLWGENGNKLDELIEADRDSALIGAKEALEAIDDPWWWQPGIVIDRFSSQELRDAAFPLEVIERREREEAFRDQQRETPPPEAQADVNAPEIAENLSRLLGLPREDGDPYIQFSAFSLSREVSDLSDVESADLRDRLEGWWRDDFPFVDAFNRSQAEDGNGTISVVNWAGAWMWYGPKLEVPLSPGRWSQVAVAVEFMFEEQFEWLKANATVDGQAELAQIVSNTSAGFWLHVMSSIEGPIIPQLVERMVDCLIESDSDEYEMEYVARRLSELAEFDALRTLAGAGEQTHRVVSPYLAAAGDSDEIRFQLDQLKDLLERRERPSRESLLWLEGVREPEFLTTLFECLQLALTNEAPANDFDFTSGPIVNAIYEIGGTEAIRRYDEILENTDDPRLLFLRPNRLRVAEKELARLSARAAPSAAEAVSLPLIVDLNDGQD